VRFRDRSIDVSQLEDRRGGGLGRGGFGGRRGGTGLAVGGGGLGIVGVLIALLLGVDPFGGGGAAIPDTLDEGITSDVAQRCTSEPDAVQRYDDCFVLKVFNEVNEVWTDTFAARGGEFVEPTLVYFDGATQTGCGPASSAVGPFYCPADERVYIDLGFLRELQQRFGAPGRSAQAYVVAHEVGHHVQQVTGTATQVRQAQQQRPSAANRLSVRQELQADCYAGVWSSVADAEGEVAITRDDLEDALGAAEAVGDDRIQEATQGRVDPESFTHGSGEQRRQWFLTGFDSGDPTDCDTFS